MHPACLASLVLLALVACDGDGTSTSDSGAPDAALDSAPDSGGNDGAVTDADAMADAGQPLLTFSDTYDGIHPFFTFDYKITDIAVAAPHADYVWGAQQENISKYRASSNPKIVLSEYIPFTRDPDGTHSLDYWKNLHPDWVLYQCDRTTPAYEFGDPNIPLDMSNPAVIDWQVQNYAVPAAVAGYDAIAADNFILYNQYDACGIYENGQWKMLYTSETDPQYTTDAINWAKTFGGKIHALSPKPLGLIPNYGIPGDYTATDSRLLELLPYVDAILDEGGYTNFSSGFPSEGHWNEIVKYVEYVQSLGKAYYSINQFNDVPVTDAEAQWSLASYLMSKEHASSIFIAGNQQYGSDLYRPEYDAKIGTPCGAMQKSQGVYMRELKHGLSLVNPTSVDATFNLPAGTWQDLYGNAVGTSVSMPSDSGMVLIDAGGSHC